MTSLPQTIKAVMFDMDGVLLDSERCWRTYTPNFWKDCGINDLPETLSKQIYGISMSEEYALIQKTIGIQMTLQEYVAAYDKYSYKVYSKAPLANELENILTVLKRRGLKLAIVTSSLGKWVELFFNRLSRRDYFDVIVSIADTEGVSPKPAPDGYLHALKLLGFESSQAIAIEDSNRGIKSARAAQLFTIASTEFIDDDYTQSEYDYCISSLAQLVNFIPNS